MNILPTVSSASRVAGLLTWKPRTSKSPDFMLGVIIRRRSAPQGLANALSSRGVPGRKAIQVRFKWSAYFAPTPNVPRSARGGSLPEQQDERSDTAEEGASWTKAAARGGY